MEFKEKFLIFLYMCIFVFVLSVWELREQLFN